MNVREETTMLGRQEPAERIATAPRHTGPAITPVRTGQTE